MFGRACRETVLRVFGGPTGKGHRICGASTSGGSKASAAAVIGQTFMNLGDSDVMVQPRLKIQKLRAPHLPECCQEL